LERHGAEVASTMDQHLPRLRRLCHVRATVRHSEDEPAFPKLGNGVPHSTPGHAVLLLQARLGRDRPAGSQRAIGDLSRQDVRQLLVDGHRPIWVDHDVDRSRPGTKKIF
jgi:hypothetical protein